MENNTALIMVDVEDDFCPGGALAVAGGDLVVAPLNALSRQMVYNQRKGANLLVIATRDRHPAVCEHFSKWPPHCVDGTPGAEFHKALDLNGAHILTKGFDVIGDAYSPFEGTMDETGETLDEFLKRHGITTVIIGGLALDYCVKAAAIDAAKRGYNVILLLDATKAVDPTNFEQVLNETSEVGVLCSGWASVLGVFTLGQEVIDAYTPEFDPTYT